MDICKHYHVGYCAECSIDGLEAENAELKSIVERLESLAVKWVDAGHHDWPEIKELIKRMDELTATQPEESEET